MAYEFTDEEKAEIERKTQRAREREAWFPTPSVAHDCEVITSLLCSALHNTRCTHDDTKPPHVQVDPRFALWAGADIGAANVRSSWLVFNHLGYAADSKAAAPIEAVRDRACELTRVVQRFVESQFNCAWSRHMHALGAQEAKAAHARERRRLKREAVSRGIE